MNLCQYSDILGKPNEGLHSYRIFNLPVVDVIMTIIFAYVIYIVVNKSFNLNYSYWVYLIIFYLIGFVLHKIFCVQTYVIKTLNL